MADARALDALRALAQTALRVGRDTTSARLALAHLHEVVDPAALPADVRDRVVAELEAAARAAAVPIAFRDVERILSDAWGAKPAAELDELDAEPAAVTPGAQVHRGVLDGRRVAVKVLRPGIVEVIRSDLGLADALLRPLGVAFPRIDPSALVAEARERILDELDLEHEGSTQRSFHRALRRHPALFVPAVHGALTHERVLVTDWVDGRPVLAATAAERPAVARALVAFHVGGARFGTVHADPHPGNALLMDDGRVAFLDFGAARRVDRARGDGAVAALDALAAGDDASLGAALGTPGLAARRTPAGRPAHWPVSSSASCSTARRGWTPPRCCGSASAWRRARGASPRSARGRPSRPRTSGRCGCSRGCSRCSRGSG